MNAAVTFEGRRNARRLIWVSLFFLFVGALSLAVWRFAYVAALDQLARRGQADLALAADGLSSGIEQSRELAVLLADHPVLRPAIQGSLATPDAVRLLQQVADKTGSLAIAIADRSGREIATSVEGQSKERHAGRPHFERAMDGALGLYHEKSENFARRVFLFAAPVFSEAGPVIGAVLVTANVEAIEASWRGDRPAIFFTDESGVVFLSNRSELIFSSRSLNQKEVTEERYDTAELTPFIRYTPEPIAGRDLWDLDGGRYLPSAALHLERPMPAIDMVGEVLVDVAPAIRLAILQSAVVASICFSFGALLFLATERRRTLSEANARLESRVADRTKDLQAVNADLRREVKVRAEAEVMLKRAQAELVQAGKLSALGQMSAGISHELNQPLMAIRSFAENAQGYLERGKSDVASENLGRISDLARRMGRIIQNLRAFARQETVPAGVVDLCAVIDAVIEVSGPKARSVGAKLVWNRPAGPIYVIGGEVRLQQVILNLIGNSLDAMENSSERRVDISLVVGDRTTVTIRDTGPGISEPEKIFEPFYSTKSVGSAEGMGLGLSISYGIVQSFGGDIQGRNHPDGGAVFSLSLESAEAEEAA